MVLPATRDTVQYLEEKRVLNGFEEHAASYVVVERTGEAKSSAFGFRGYVNVVGAVYHGISRLACEAHAEPSRRNK